MPPSLRMQKVVNKWGARVIPLILFALIGYSIYVVIASVAVGYLLRHPSWSPKQTRAGIAVLVIYSVLLGLMLASFLRVIQVVLTNPGLAPRSQTPSLDEHKPSESSAESNASAEKVDSQTPSEKVGYLDRRSVSGGNTPPPPGLEQFYMRDVFECEQDGLPRWCSSCKIWKLDRSHHCSEIDRCAYKMDHFCPWAGGIISETTFKFFALFCLYSAFLCIFIIIVSAYFVAQTSRENSSINANWIVIIIISALFGLFSGAIGVNSLRFALINSTTVDSLTQKTRIYHFAVLIPPHLASQPDTTRSYPTITYPLHNTSLEPAANRANTEPRTFAILATPPGENPYRLASMFDNFKQVFGDYPWDWFFPIRYSPSVRDRLAATRLTGLEEGGQRPRVYKLGPVIERMKRDAGLPYDGAGEKS